VRPSATNYRPWRYGDRLPYGYYSQRYIVNDYYAYRLRPPPYRLSLRARRPRRRARGNRQRHSGLGRVRKSSTEGAAPLSVLPPPRGRPGRGQSSHRRSPRCPTAHHKSADPVRRRPTVTADLANGAFVMRFAFIPWIVLSTPAGRLR
jgi:hypothetical protein